VARPEKSGIFQAMTDLFHPVEVNLGRQGRLVLEKPEVIKQRLKARFARVPGDRHLVDELLAERREEINREGKE
jgi:hypothetical protein